MSREVLVLSLRCLQRYINFRIITIIKIMCCLQKSQVCVDVHKM